MENGNEELARKILGEQNMINFEAWNREWERRMIYGIPDVIHTDSEGNQRLLSIEETLTLLSRDTKYWINPDVFLKDNEDGK